MIKPLSELRVLDLTSVVVGPACTWRLAEYGADVIKVESPSGDLMRGLGGGSPTGTHSGTYLHLNKGKRNICIDLKKDESKTVMDRLIESSDVIVANMRPQALKKLGLDSESIRSKHPDIIYCLITGYGTDGPYAGEPAYDSVIQGASGIAGLAYAREGSPKYVPMLVCDHIVGEIAAGAIISAILHRHATGSGCEIEVPMFETMSSFVLQEHLAQTSFEPPVGPPGDQRLLSTHNQPVKTADGWISFTINTDKQVKSFFKVTNRQELQGDPRFSSISARAENVAEWFEIRGAPLTSKKTSQWLDIFRRADIAAKPCHTLDTLPQDPHLKSVRLIEFHEHPTEGSIASIRSTIRYNGEYSAKTSLAQPKGWETKAILHELNFSNEEIDALTCSKVVVSTKS